MAGEDASPDYLAACLWAVDLRVRQAVARRRATDSQPDDNFRGLYISESHVDELLSRPASGRFGVDEVIALDASTERAADEAEGRGTDIRLRSTARRFVLSGLDVWLLLVALAPDLDPRYEALYGYLHDDVTRRRASVGLGLELCLGTLLSGAARDRLAPTGPLVAGGVLIVEDPDRPFLTRSLRVPDRVTAYLLGSDECDPLVSAALAPQPNVDLPAVTEVATLFRAQPNALVYAKERPGGAGHALGANALRVVGQKAITLDFARVAAENLPATVAAAIREARLTGCGIVAGDIEGLTEHHRQSLRLLADAALHVVLIGRRSWDPSWSSRPAFLVDAPPLPEPVRVALWHAELAVDETRSCVEEGTGAGEADVFAADVALVTIGYRLAPDQIARAGVAARLRAKATTSDGQSVRLTKADVQAGARAQNAGGLERLARRVAPSVTWDDLVVPPDVRAQLREIAARARLRDHVLGTWGLGGRGGRRLGVAALFAGPSGTGKTMAAETVAGALGLDLYTIDLATVVDKYIGETEKNLERIFTEAERVSAVVFFDEADALFGKRSEVSDARDRYANIEVAYLLQRMEQFEGIAILATNLRANVDDAFARRLDALIDFPMPEAEDRRKLWERSLGPRVPQDRNVDLDFMAERFKLSGGNIRNIAVAAAFLAADAGRPLDMAALIVSTSREYRKLGRLCLEAEFGPYHSLVP